MTDDLGSNSLSRTRQSVHEMTGEEKAFSRKAAIVSLALFAAVTIGGMAAIVWLLPQPTEVDIAKATQIIGENSAVRAWHPHHVG